MPGDAKIGQLVRWNVKKSRTFVRSLEPRIASQLSARLGTVFGVMSAEADARTGDALAARLEDAVIRGIEEADRKLPVTSAPDQLFEHALSRVNQSLSRLFGAGGLPIDAGGVRACLIARDGDSIAAAVWGNPSLLLIRPSKALPFDVLDEAKNERSGSIAYRAPSGFGSIIAGELSPGDNVLLSTEDLRPLIGDAKLADIVAENTPEAASIIIRDLLAPLADNLAIAVTVFGSTQPAPADIARVARPESPIPRETPSEPKKREEPAPADIMNLPEAGPKAAIGTMKRPGALIALGRKSSRIALSLFDRERRVAAIDAVKRAPFAAVERFNGLSRPKKAVAIGACALAIIFNVSLVVLGWQRKAAAKTEAYEQAVADVEHLIDSADASLIYRDEARAKGMLDEAATGVAALPAVTAAQTEKRDALTAKIEEKRVSSRREVALPAPNRFPVPGHASFATVVGSSTWAASGGSLVRVATDGGTQIVAALPGGKPLGLQPVTDGMLALGGEGALLAPDKGTAKKLLIDWKGDVPDATEAAPWGSSLYVLDASHNRILKLRQGAAGFGAPAPYLKDGTDLTGAVSLAIDGSVYVLMRDGKAVKVEKGSALPFALSPVEPPVTNATRIRTTEDSPFLYVLEPPAKRVIKYSKKTGQFVAQYANESLFEAKDIAFDEKNGALIATGDGVLLRFVLPQ